MENKKREMFLGKVREWQHKAKQEVDAFNRYISVFIAYNILYNLYKKTKYPGADLSSGDSTRAIATIDLVEDPDELISLLRPCLDRYLNMLPIYREEYWPRPPSGLPITKKLKEAISSDESREAIRTLLMWLYKVRCNLVHGEKGYKDTDQMDLLSESSVILDKILGYLMRRYEELHID